MIDGKRDEYDNETYEGVDSADELAIILALRKGEKLVIDRNGHIYDSTGRWIADGMRRSLYKITICLASILKYF